MLFRFLSGNGNPVERQLSHNILRIVFCGNTFASPDSIDSVDKGHGHADNNQVIYNTLVDLLDQTQEYIDRLSHVIKVDVMPGELELSNQFLPQQPLSKCMFPDLQDEQHMMNR